MISTVTNKATSIITSLVSCRLLVGEEIVEYVIEVANTTCGTIDKEENY